MDMFAFSCSGWMQCFVERVCLQVQDAVKDVTKIYKVYTVYRDDWSVWTESMSHELTHVLCLTFFITHYSYCPYF